ncbi:hypothetical protein KAJ02_07920, partial [Candidatus Bipolaricaulota bacterium]|nr:hypothetical protein [Candidatus Bipolaricaulota bacterium]
MIMRIDRLRRTEGKNLAEITLPVAVGVLVAIFSVLAAANTVVDFPDPGLEEAIRAATWNPTGDIYDTDLIGLTELNADNRNIVNLEGIQHCIDLVTLGLNDNRIVDIGPLA